MSYVGNTNTTQAFTPAIDYFSGNASTTAFTLSRPVASVAQVQVVVNNVAQNPSSAYTVSSNTITFTSAPSSGTNNIYVYYTSPITQVTTLTQDPVITGNLNFGSTGARITGDFTNATIANRVMFQTSTTNGNTVLNLIPNGTGTTCAFGMDSDPALTNSSTGSLNLVASTDVRLSSGIRGTGTYLPMTFYTGGSERMRIDTAGITKFRSTGSAYDSTPGDGVSDGLYLQVDSSGIAHIDSYAGGGSTTLAFGTNSGGGAVSERMRIDSSGNLLVGTTANAITAYTASKSLVQSADYSGAVAQLINSTSTTGTQYFLAFGRGASVCGQITSGATNSTTYATSSDYRLKKDVQPMKGALAKVQALKPCTYKWIEDDTTSEGFIAHELAEVCPDAVVGEKDAVNAEGNPVYQGVDTSFLVATLTAAIQEQQALITALTARIEALENK